MIIRENEHPLPFDLKIRSQDNQETKPQKEAQVNQVMLQQNPTNVYNEILRYANFRFLLAILTGSNSLHTRDGREGMFDAFQRANLNTSAPWKTGVLHEILINLSRALTALLNSPYNKRLAAAAVAGREHSLNACGITVWRGRNVRPCISLQSKSLCTIIRTQKSHAQKRKVGREKLLRLWYLSVSPLTLLVFMPV